jgi:hypothetical protein
MTATEGLSEALGLVGGIISMGDFDEPPVEFPAAGGRGSSDSDGSMMPGSLSILTSTEEVDSAATIVVLVLNEGEMASSSRQAVLTSAN